MGNKFRCCDWLSYISLFKARKVCIPSSRNRPDGPQFISGDRVTLSTRLARRKREKALIETVSFPTLPSPSSFFQVAARPISHNFSRDIHEGHKSREETSHTLFYSPPFFLAVIFGKLERSLFFFLLLFRFLPFCGQQKIHPAFLSSCWGGKQSFVTKYLFYQNV